MELFDRAFGELSTLELHDIMALRVDVFVVEQACAYRDLDGRDVEPATRHIWFADEGIVAYLRVLDDGDSRRIGRVVTAPAARGEGRAAELVDHAVASTAGPWVLDAQSHLVDWYAARGFAIDGAEFVEDGIAHTPMRRV
ncbi:MAG: GNAT family N-acetyltransferase [Acidimicrobiales bacterium]